MSDVKRLAPYLDEVHNRLNGHAYVTKLEDRANVTVSWCPISARHSHNQCHCVSVYIYWSLISYLSLMTFFEKNPIQLSCGRNYLICHCIYMLEWSLLSP